MNARLPRSQPDQQGIPADALLRTIQRMEKQEVHGVMILRNGSVVAESWWKPFESTRVHQLFSLSKSFCSTAIGFAVDERRFTLEDRVLKFFPELAPENPSENLRQMRIRDLLTMSTGHEVEVWGSPQYDPADLRKSFLRHPVTAEPGTRFLYNSPATYMCSAILQKVTGLTLTEYLKPRLFDPLDFGDIRWEKDNLGIEWGGWGMYAKLEDIAKFGQLLIQKGVWSTRRILPTSWVEQATARQVENGKRGQDDWQHGYGFQFWRCQVDGYRGDGAFGQLCVVIPEARLVVTANASVDDIQALLLPLWEELLPALKDTAIPADTGAQTSLERYLGSREIPTLKDDPAALPNPELAGTYDLEATAGVLRLELARDNVHVELTGRAKSDFLAGFGQFLPGMLAGEPVVASAAWREKGQLELKIRWLEKTMGESWTFRPMGNRLTIVRVQRGTIGHLGAPEMGDLVARKRI